MSFQFHRHNQICALDCNRGSSTLIQTESLVVIWFMPCAEPSAPTWKAKFCLKLAMSVSLRDGCNVANSVCCICLATHQFEYSVGVWVGVRGFAEDRQFSSGQRTTRYPQLLQINEAEARRLLRGSMSKGWCCRYRTIH